MNDINLNDFNYKDIIRPIRNVISTIHYLRFLFQQILYDNYINV